LCDPQRDRRPRERGGTSTRGVNSISCTMPPVRTSAALHSPPGSAVFSHVGATHIISLGMMRYQEESASALTDAPCACPQDVPTLPKKVAGGTVSSSSGKKRATRSSEENRTERTGHPSFGSWQPCFPPYFRSTVISIPQPSACDRRWP
jgi:hypothetical protein